MSAGEELRWSTGQVGPHHRAIMRGGRVLAIAEDTETASVIVRRLNEETAEGKARKLLHGLLRTIEEIANRIEKTGIGAGGEEVIVADLRDALLLEMKEKS